MYHNEKGFVYPLTFTIIFAAFFLLTIQLEQYISEKRLTEEAETVLKQEYYLLNSLKRTEILLKEKKEYDLSGSYSFAKGNVSYSMSPLAASLYQITFKTKVGSDSEITTYAYYDIDLEKVIKWIEKN
ncbi:competence type IV pilus minor pilin ComGG [Cytobacillus oceanisediminis]|uniref:Competence protein ComGG n=1 Tax=Cytobacillus oceanisediminis TaxID=665099 RepID=A0A562K0G1_9BACI|nr:competence type IV pilus minor pilin ComGG [Cytobacillus oceanisediminis]TWH88918.1 competence protein ComGG [Cytobacillus oceanisediminis]